ncbi:unnamed protein product [Prorocentrum cordatum]|uniref:Secreted protein n=1 Tax=Prorocentrum cordatum TaxID=2364126 RepID=A0ABN9S125_9DINO|nr:unnamed protein product [Polarella glacialis]
MNFAVTWIRKHRAVSLFMVAWSLAGSSEDASFDVVPLVPREGKLALCQRLVVYLSKYTRLKVTWWAKRSCAQEYTDRRERIESDLSGGLNMKNGCELRGTHSPILSLDSRSGKA